jgi:hypothetical protein
LAKKIKYDGSPSWREDTKIISPSEAAWRLAAPLARSLSLPNLQTKAHDFVAELAKAGKSYNVKKNITDEAFGVTSP